MLCVLGFCLFACLHLDKIRHGMAAKEGYKMSKFTWSQMQAMSVFKRALISGNFYYLCYSTLVTEECACSLIHIHYSPRTAVIIMKLRGSKERFKEVI